MDKVNILSLPIREKTYSSFEIKEDGLPTVVIRLEAPTFVRLLESQALAEELKQLYLVDGMPLRRSGIEVSENLISLVAPIYTMQDKNSPETFYDVMDLIEIFNLYPNGVSVFLEYVNLISGVVDGIKENPTCAEI